MVVLLDEVEKAHPLLFDVLLQVLGEGRLTDGAGRVADFTSAVVIMTSNLGADSFRRAAMGFGSGSAAAEHAHRHFEGEVRRFLRPEMFNRLDRIVPFGVLDRETIINVARREVDRLTMRDGIKLRAVKFDFDQAVIDELAAQGYDARYGARPLKRSIEQRLVAPLAERLCGYAGDLGIECRVRMEEGGLRVSTAARPAAEKEQLDATTAGSLTIEQLNEVTKLRRKAQLLQRSSVILQMRNEIYRIKQAELQRQRRAKRRGKAEQFKFTKQDAYVLAQEELLKRVDSVASDICSLEDTALGDFYSGRPGDRGGTTAACERLSGSLRELLLELLQSHTGSRNLLTLVIFGPVIQRVVQLARAYLRVCESSGNSQVLRYWLKVYRSELDQSAVKLARQRPAPQQPVPVMHLMGRCENEKEVPRKVVDVYVPPPHQFGSPPDDVIGVALQITGARAVTLLESESGKHEFARVAGKPVTCTVETHSAILIKYSPPADVGRLGFVSNFPLRRAYDEERETCRDPVLQKDFRLRGSIEEVVAEATTEYLSARLWSLLD